MIYRIDRHKNNLLDNLVEIICAMMFPLLADFKEYYIIRYKFFKYWPWWTIYKEDDFPKRFNSIEEAEAFIKELEDEDCK